MDNNTPPPVRQRTAAPLPATEPPARVESSALLKVRQHLNKHYGAGTAQKAVLKPICRHLATGVFTLDLALLGGLPENYPFMIYGENSSSKTTMMLRIVASFQRKYPDKVCVWVDPETTFDKLWAIKQGVDVDALELVQPGAGEVAVDAIKMYAELSEVSFIALDSIGSLCPMDYLDKSAEDQSYASQAKLVGRLCGVMSATTDNERKKGHYFTFGAINQFRDSQKSYGSPNKLPGGRQLNFYMMTKILLKGKVVMGKNAHEDDVKDHIEQSFVIEKHKVGSSIEAGEWIMHMNPSGVGSKTLGRSFPQGTPLDAVVVAAQAKRMGFITGGGASWRFQGIPGLDQHRFGKLVEIEEFFYANPDQFLLVKQFIIAEYRRSDGLPRIPPDHYLLGPVNWQTA